MPTRKQEEAVKNMVENGGNVSRAMIDANYSPATAKTPQKLTESKGFEELMEEYYPDHKVEAVLAEALDANRTISAISGNKANGGTVDFVDVPDWSTRIDAVKEIHKVKGKYPATKSEITGKDGAPLFAQMSDEQLLEIINDTKEKNV